MPNAGGISKAGLDIVRNKFADMDDREKLVTLCMDKISLKTHLSYDIKIKK